MKKTTKDIISIVLKALLVVGVIVGVYAQGNSGINFMAAKRYLFFTIQSNLTIGVVCLVFAVIEIINLIRNKQGKESISIPNWLYTVKLAFTVAISLTFLVFSVILTPDMIAKGNISYLASASNICCHNLVPIIAIADYLIFNRNHKTNKLTFLWGCAMPLYYVAFAFICDAFAVDFGQGVTVPYFFFNYHLLGWFTISANGIGVVYWIALQVLMVIGISWALVAIKNAINRKQALKQIDTTQEQASISSPTEQTATTDKASSDKQN